MIRGRATFCIVPQCQIVMHEQAFIMMLRIISDVIQTAALYLRTVIQAMPKWETPFPTSVATPKTCSLDLPDELLLFYKTLLLGLREPSSNASKEAVERK